MDESVFRRHWLKAQLAQTESLQDASHRRQILNELLVYARASRMRHFRYWVAIMYVPSLLGLMGHGGALYLITRVEWVGYLALVPTLMFLWEVMAPPILFRSDVMVVHHLWSWARTPEERKSGRALLANHQRVPRHEIEALEKELAELL